MDQTMLDALITSRTRTKLLMHLMDNPDKRCYLRGLERELNESATQIRRELRRLEESGFLSATEEANIRYYSVNRESPLFGRLLVLMGRADSVRLIQACGPYGEETAQPEETTSEPEPVNDPHVEPESQPAQARVVQEPQDVKPRRALSKRRVGWFVCAFVVLMAVLQVLSMVYMERRFARLQTARDVIALSGSLARRQPPLIRSDAPYSDPDVRTVESFVPTDSQDAAYTGSRGRKFQVMPGTW